MSKQNNRLAKVPESLQFLSVDVNNVQTKAEMHKAKAAVGMKAVVLNQAGKILVLIRSADDCARPSGYDFPGGGLEIDENPTNGIRREIKEETGLEVSKVKPIDTRSWREDDGCFSVMIVFQAQATSDQVRVSQEHKNYQWMSKTELLSSDMPEDFKEFIKAAQM